MEGCDFGKVLKSDCHKSVYSRQTFIKEFIKLTPYEQEIILWRSELRNHKDEVTTICNHHMQKYGPVFERNHDKCCDVFNTHKKKVKGDRMISLDSAKQLESKGFRVIPGFKFCYNCTVKSNNISKSICEISVDEVNMEVDHEFHIEETSIREQPPREQLDSSLISLGESPVKLHGLASHRRIPVAKRKFDKAVEKLEDSVANVYGVNVSELQKSDLLTDTTSIIKKAEDLDRLTLLMKEKIRTSSFTQIVQILTMTPESWSREYAAKYFNVSEHLVRKARTLKHEKGIFAMPSNKIGKTLTKEVTALVETFYQDDEYSRLMPGKKDYVSVGKGLKDRVHEQKRLLLCNLRELYTEFKRINPSIKIGFSKFCSLRPKWCVNAGSAGTHSVCVCTYHQNAILLLSAISWDMTYKDLMAKIVCNTSSNECMVHRCSNCPGTDHLKTFLDEELHDIDHDQEFHFNQWQSTDRSQLITQTVTVDEYKDIVIKCIDALTSHSYISKCQTQYLKNLKENLSENECIILGDFAENYEYVVQDEIQSYHWCKNGCTLHPVVIYFKIEEDNVNKLEHKSFCFMSDDKNHDTCFVYEIQKHITAYIKTNLPWVTKIHYFSDGCGGQYKNYKNFLNLCLHFKDFGLKAEWVFFATSHGKSPCDGIGGTVKRTTAKASLQRATHDQILSVESMYEFCTSKMKDIIFVLIDVETMTALRPVLNKRFEVAETIPGTRSFHHYIPISETSITFKRTSEDIELQSFDLISGCRQPTVKSVFIKDLKTMDFVACKYDQFWWVGIVEEVDGNNKDIHVKFMHPHGPSKRFSWPPRDDLCWLPIDNILTKISIPTTRSGRIYDISEQDYNTIINSV